MNFRSKVCFIKLTFLLIAFLTFTSTQAAKLYFNDIYKATGSSYTIQPSSLDGISSISGSGFKFTSANPADVSFSGNNIAGILTYTNSSNQFISLYGVISRQNKANGRTMAVNFMPTDYTYTNVTGEGYILVIPTKESSFSNGDNVGTSSDPIAAVLNDVLDTQNSSPIISVNDVTVNNTDSYAVFTISLSRAANAITTFTPSLLPVTAALNTDYTNSMEYYNGSTWVNISTTVSIAQNATSIQIRVPILNGGAVSSNTFNLNTGTVTGSNVLNSDGAYGIGTILPGPSLTVNGNLKTFSTCSGCSVATQSFSVSGTNLSTNNIVVTAPTGFQVSTNVNSGFATSINIAPTSGTVTTTTVYAKLTNNALTASSGVISVTSTGATAKTITVTTNTDNALNFDGVDDIISSASNISSLNITGDITVETWIRLNQMPTDYVRLIGKGSPAERTYGLWLYSDGSLLWQQYNTNSSINNLVTNASIIPVGKWCHIAVAKTGSNVKIYINGNQVASSIAYSGTPNSSTAPLEIGGSSSIHSLLNGMMDEVRIWNVGRTASQIANSYLSELVGDGNSNETGLVAYYNFNLGTDGGTNSSISVIEDRTSNGISATLNNFAKTGSTSNFVSGSIPDITAVGNANTVLAGGTLALSNGLLGGVWSSSNTNIASINTTTGLVTGVAAGTATMSYTICNKVVTYVLTVLAPTITTGSLKTFTSCSGCTISAQTFTVAGTNLGANVVVTAPTGFEVSNASAGTYSATLSLTPSAGTLATTNVYARLINTATTASNGNFTVASTGAISKTITATVNTDNALMFDGVDDYVNLGDAFDIATLSYTTEAWVYWKGSSNPYSEIFTKDLVQSFSITSDNKLHANFGNGTSWSSGLNSTTLVPLNKWTHLAVTRSSSGVVKMYINGILDASTNTMNVTGNNTAIRGIGGKLVGTLDGPFAGAIDNLKVWNTEKTNADITNGMYSELAGNETNLLAYYDFNQGVIGGTNTAISSLLDMSNSVTNGTFSGFSLTGSNSNFVNGFIPGIQSSINASGNNNALSFDGTNDYVITNVNGTTLNEFTIETFINPSNTTQNTKGILQWANGSTTSGNPMVLMQQNGTQLSVYVNSGYNLTTTISANTWSHIALVYANSLYTLYVNGVSVATYSGGISFQTNATQFYLGTGYNGHWNGKIDEVRVWNIARSANQINNNMYVDLSGTEAGLLAYYNMNQGTANGSNTSSLTDKTSNALNGTLTNFALAGTSSNYVTGNTQIGSSVTMMAGTTYQLANALIGGTWASSNTSFATVNSSTGVVTGIAAGSVSITYSICGKSVSYPVTVYTPTLTTTSLKIFTSCSGCTITPQTFTVTGSNLGANVIVTAPSGFEVSNASNGTYSNTLVLSPSLVSSSQVSVYAKLSNSAITASSGTFTIASTGVTTKTVTATINTDNALNFDGVNDYVSIPDNNALDLLSAFTIEGWVYPKSSTGAQVIVGKLDECAGCGNSSNTAYALRYNNGQLLAQISDGTSNYKSISSSNLVLNKWQHVAMVFDGANAILSLYINGVLQSSTSTGYNTIKDGIYSLKLGSYGTNYGQYFNGSMDNIKIWNTVKSQTDITNGMFTELAGNEAGLVAFYNFNQGTASGSNSSISVIQDRTSNGFSGTLTNFAKTGSTSNFVAGFIPEISGQSILNKGLTTNYTNGLTGGTWSSSSTNIATVNSSTGVVTGVNPGTSTITYTVCEKTVTKVVTVVVPSITKTGSLTTFNTCLGTASAAQTFTVSAEYLTANLFLTAPTGYEISTDGSTYSSTLIIAPTSGAVSARSIYVRLSTASINGQSGNISITSTDATSQNISTGTASVTRTVAASVTISSNATNNRICAGSNVLFTATPTNGGSAPTYQWKLNGNNITGANSATYSTTSLANNDVITVLMGSSLTSCVTGTPAASNSITTIVTAIPASPSNINGTAIICMNSNQVYSIPAVIGATSYTWVVSGGITASPSTTNVINITAANNAGSGTIKVLASNACGSSVYSNDFNVTISNQPAPTASFTVSGNTVCLTSAGITFTSTSTPNATTSSPIGTYTWAFGDGASATTATASNTYTSSGTFDAILTIEDANQCISSVSNRITVDPTSVAGTATAANSTICEGSNTVLTLTGNTGEIQWQQSSDNISFTNISGATGTTFNTGNLTATTYYRAVVTSGSCSFVTSGVITVTVNPTPNATLGSVSNISTNSTSFDLAYSNLVGNPDEYSINAVGPNALPNFNAISNFGLSSSPINVIVPASAIGTYNFNLIVKNGAIGCISSPIPFTVTIVPLPPAGLTYITPNVYTSGTTINPLNPTSTGGPISQYSIAPTLPAGLTINATSGIISGTPSAVSSQTSYTVTGTNASGTITATVVITVNTAAPLSLSYSTPNVYTTGTVITALNPTSSGGAITSYSINPSLPAGLTIDPITGIISGTPTATSAQTSYTIIGTNISGTVTATVVITVNGSAVAPVVQSQTEYCVQEQVSEYKYVKVVFSNTKNLSSANSIQVADWKWFNGNSEISRSNVTVTNPNGSNPGGEGPSNIYDGSTSTKWLDFNIKSGNNTSTLLFTYPGTGVRITGYSWVTANDSEERDPKSWIVYMSNDNVNWTQVHTVSNYTSPSSRFTATSAWTFANSSAEVTLTATATTGYTLRWYTTSTGGTATTTAPILNTSAPATVTYYVSQINQAGYETPRSTLTVNVNALPAAPVVSGVNYTVGATASALTATALSSHNLQWYTAASGGTASTTAPTPSTASIGTVNYYVSQVNSVTGCEGPRANISVVTSIAAPASLSYTTPNVYTTGTAITALNPTSTGGAIASYSISPSLPAGLTLNTSTGIISGTPTSATAQLSYIITGTNTSGTVSSTVVITVNSNIVPQPQGSLSAVDFGLLASDTVKLKLTTSNGTAPFTLILSNSLNTLKDTISNLTPVNNIVEFLHKKLDTTKVFTIFKLIDANNNIRTSGFTKDTTIINVLKPQILLTLKADPAVKQADNSFKTRLLLKIKNAGQLDLRNVQINANLSKVFPSGISYVLDSVKVLSGGLVLNPTYSGAGSATAASSSDWVTNASVNGSKSSYAVLDGNYLLNNGVNLNRTEEGEVAFYVSIGATTQNVVLKLQFETAGNGVIAKNDGSSSTQETTSKSDDGTDIVQHPDLTNNGVPLPTYVPLFPNEKIGASLNVSSATPVAGGYQFHFTAKVKNYGNVNLDSIRIQYNFNEIYPSPDQAVLVGIPTITRGNIVYNLNNFDGYSNVNLFNYGGDLQVGDSATYEYDLKVNTTRTAYTWQNYFVVYGRAVNSGVFVNDTSMAGIDPDPNNDNDPLERFFTGATINFVKPLPPTVENKTYTYGQNNPSNISGLVKSTPIGTIPVWCDTKTAACSINPPSTPTEIGFYVFALRSYDTTTLLYSEVLVYDTVIIKPPVPIVVNKKYIIGAVSNPINIVGQVTGMTGSTLKYFKSATLQSAIPVLGNVPGLTRYTASQIVNGIESDTVGFTVTMLDPKTMLHLQKIAEEPRLQSNSTYNITYTFLVNNRTDEAMSNVLVVDNLQNTFPQPTVFTKVSLSSTGGLTINNGYNGMSDINLINGTSTLAPFTTDTIRLTINLQPKGYTGTVNNIAVITATTPYGIINMNSSSQSFANEISKTPTPSLIPDLTIDIPEAFSPNRDGVNDRFIILKPFGTILDLEVFNRWGNVVYANPNYNNEWDGRGTNNFIGQDLMDGGYYYTLKAKSVNGNIQIFKGFVLIQR